MAWSKRHRVQLAVALVVVLASVASVAVVIAIWKTNSASNSASRAETGYEIPSSSPVVSPAPTEQKDEGRLDTQYPTELPTDLSAPRPTTNAQTSPPTTTAWPTIVPLSPPPTSSPTTLPFQPTVSPTSVTTFYAFADAPYNSRESIELAEQVKAIPADAEFVIFLGDIRSASDGDVCKLTEFENFASIMQPSPVPVFMIVGDNEWNDCSNINAAWGFWNATFMRFENNWDHSFDVIRLPGREENFAFLHRNTLFMGLNLVGGRVHSSTEWKDRLTDQVEWTKSLILETAEARAVVIFGHANPTGDHSKFFSPLTTFIQNTLQNRIPILYLNGDAHLWNHEPYFYGQRNFLRIQLTGGTLEPPLKVQVDASSSLVDGAFSYDRQLN